MIALQIISGIWLAYGLTRYVVAEKRGAIKASGFNKAAAWPVWILMGPLSHLTRI